MGVLTGYSRRTASLNSGSGGGGGGNTIYTANDTITDNTRTVSLFGNTSSQWLKFVNLDSRNILKLKGDRTIEMGENGYNAFLKMWVDVGSNNNVILTDGTNDFVTFNAAGRTLKMFDSSGNTGIILQANSSSGLVNSYGAGAGHRTYNNSGLLCNMLQASNTGTGELVLMKADSTYNILLNGGGNSYINGTIAIGIDAVANASCQVDIISTTKGLGLPSMTTTQKNAIASPRAGLMVFDNVLTQISYYTGTVWVNL
jgi:hypothetical protein